jgi:ubiquinone/menaquinone biosynthesis C-methylase UbiE
MDMDEGSVVAHVGAGAGFLTVRLASAVGQRGRVYAVDIVPDVLNRLRERVSMESLTNVYVVEGIGTTRALRLPHWMPS